MARTPSSRYTRHAHNLLTALAFSPVNQCTGSSFRLLPDVAERLRAPSGYRPFSRNTLIFGSSLLVSCPHRRASSKFSRRQEIIVAFYVILLNRLRASN